MLAAADLITKAFRKLLPLLSCRAARPDAVQHGLLPFSGFKTVDNLLAAIRLCIKSATT